MEGLDFQSSISTAAASIGNVGLGFGSVGPSQNYSGFSSWAKMFLSLLMLMGRLELFTIIALISPKSWKNDI